MSTIDPRIPQVDVEPIKYHDDPIVNLLMGCQMYESLAIEISKEIKRQQAGETKSKLEETLDKYATIKIFEAIKSGIDPELLPIDVNTAQNKEIAAFAYKCDKLSRRLEELVETINSNRYHCLLALGKRMVDDGIADFTLMDDEGCKQAKFLGKLELYTTVENMELAIPYLESIGGGGVIKTEIQTPDSDEEIDRLKKLLEANHFDGLTKPSIHSATLAKFMRERLEAGELEPEQDESGIKISKQKIAKITARY